MRSFRDSNETVWTVFEVRRQVSPSGDKKSYLPGGYNDGWLCFETAGAKRRLIRYPRRWRECGDTELTQLLEQAQPAPRGSFRIVDDLGDSSTSADLRPE